MCRETLVSVPCLCFWVRKVLSAAQSRFSSTNNFLSSFSFTFPPLINPFLFCLSHSFVLSLSPPSCPCTNNRTVFAQWGRSWRGQGLGFTGPWALCSPQLRPCSPPPLGFSWPVSPCSTCLSCRCCVPSTFTWRSTSEHEPRENCCWRKS